MKTDERIARRIIRILDLARSDSIRESDIDTPELAAADRIKALYSKHKQHMNFSDAADEARVEVIRAELAGLIAETMIEASGRGGDITAHRCISIAEWVAKQAHDSKCDEAEHYLHRVIQGIRRLNTDEPQPEVSIYGRWRGDQRKGIMKRSAFIGGIAALFSFGVKAKQPLRKFYITGLAQDPSQNDCVIPPIIAYGTDRLDAFANLSRHATVWTAEEWEEFDKGIRWSKYCKDNNNIKGRSE